VSEGRSIPDSWVAASSILAGVHTAAQGYPYPFWPPPGQPILADAVAELGRQLARALYSARWTQIACATLIGQPVAQPMLVGTLHGGRLLITRSPHASKFPHTGRRFDRHLLVDLRLLTWEGRRGVTRLCPQCSRPHRLKTTWLEGIGTHQVHSQPADQGLSPDGYPDVEDAAFAEMLGPLDQGLAAFDQLVIGLPPAREAHYRRLWADHPQVLTYQELIGTRKDLIIHEGPRTPGGHTQTAVPFPARPDGLPDTVRLREHHPAADPPQPPSD
jgi:hypothetical protein